MAETLEVGSCLVEAVGVHLKIDLRTSWRPDDTFFDLVRERALTNALLDDVAGKSVADANLSEKTKLQRQIIRDCHAGWLSRPGATRTGKASGRSRSGTGWQNCSPEHAAGRATALPASLSSRGPPALPLAPAIQPVDPAQDELIRLVPPAALPQATTIAAQPDASAARLRLT
jgi:hypothetical protein